MRSAAERVAVNMPIQGTAADILKRAMIDLHAALGCPQRERDARAHDSHGARRAAVRGGEEAADEVPAIVREKMESAAALDVPLTVDVGMGENWKEAKD